MDTDADRDTNADANLSTGIDRHADRNGDTAIVDVEGLAPPDQELRSAVWLPDQPAISATNKETERRRMSPGLFQFQNVVPPKSQRNLVAGEACIGKGDVIGVVHPTRRSR